MVTYQPTTKSDDPSAIFGGKENQLLNYDSIAGFTIGNQSGNGPGWLMVSTMNNDSFADMMDELDENETLEAGDECPKDGCEVSLHELTHERNPQIGTQRHPDAPEKELVCRHHGIVDQR